MIIQDRPLPGIETIPVRAAFIPGRGVVLAMRSRALKLRNWWWLMERLGL